MKQLYFLLLLVFFPFFVHAQLLLFKGQVVDQATNAPLEGVVVRAELEEVVTDAAGKFEIELAMDVTEVRMEFELPDFELIRRTILVQGLDVQDLGTIRLERRTDPNELLSREDQTPTVVISAQDLEENEDQDISQMLTASRDVFLATAAYTFGPARFRIRGYDSENTPFFINGIPYNELENGWLNFSTIGGLNDVLRNRQADAGLAPVEYTIGGVGGSVMLDTRASQQRKQLRLSYAISNRSYRNRIMATYSTGMLKNDWAFSFSGSRRWADEGFIAGTFYDAWSYFASVDKKLGDDHLLNLTAMGAPIRRGSSTAAIQELYDLAGTNYYNPHWGFQNGEKRNSRERHTHQPLFILSHEWNLSDKAILNTAVSYQQGSNGNTALDWYGASDPRPNYYRYLPSAIEDPLLAEEVANAYRNDETVRQIDWDELYNVNYNSLETIENANGVEGNTVTGLRSKYIVEDRRYDSRKINFNTIYNHFLTENINLQGGVGYQIYEGDNYKLVDDLLGGDFYLDINRFAERDFPGNDDAAQNDLSTPNRILEVGDRFGYDYNPNIRKGFAWAQGLFSYSKVDFFLGGEVSQTQFWRTGDVQNGLFPDNSFGESERQNYLNYVIKAGATYKIDQKNYLYVNGLLQTRAPFFRNAYLSPRTRDQLVPGLTQERIQSAEAGYALRGANLKARATGYYTQFEDGVWTRSFFLDGAGPSGVLDDNFVNYVITGVDKQHMGVELAVEWKVVAGLSLNGVAAIGQYIYNSRPTAAVYIDNSSELLLEEQTVYQQNFRVPGRPQTAYTFGLNYNGKKYWWANFNFNYFDNVWIDFNPTRRTEEAIFDVPSDSPEWNAILSQEKAAPAFTMDFFGGKSFKFGDMFLYLNVGVSNILDNQNFITGGYEQLRFDFEGQDPNTFPSRYFYYFGRNYFINLSFRL